MWQQIYFKIATLYYKSFEHIICLSVLYDAKVSVKHINTTHLIPWIAVLSYVLSFPRPPCHVMTWMYLGGTGMNCFHFIRSDAGPSAWMSPSVCSAAVLCRLLFSLGPWDVPQPVCDPDRDRARMGHCVIYICLLVLFWMA